MILLTHNHLDHVDLETLAHYLGEESEVTVLASGNAWQNVRNAFGGIKNNYVQFNRGTEWTENGIRFQAVYAEHSDDKAIGIVMQAEGKTYYITGDTLYNAKIFKDLPKKIDYIFIPVNGRGNNMNFADAARFCSGTFCQRRVRRIYRWQKRRNGAGCCGKVDEKVRRICQRLYDSRIRRK